MVDGKPTIHACVCGECPDVQRQGRFTKNEAGEWVEYDHYHIATCWNKRCTLYGMTLELSNHSKTVNKLKEAK